jgi:hypothetical protein
MQGRKLKRLALGIKTAILSLNLAIFAQPISPYLVGNNVWHNPSDAVWKKSSECGMQIVRIGGLAYEGAVPGELKDWIKRIQDMGAEPLVQVPSQTSAQYAADLVKNNPSVKYWNIGNETDLFGGKGAGAMAAYIKPFASAMKAVRKDIKIFVPDGAWYNFTYMPELFKDIGGKDANGNYYVDGACWHQYPFPELANTWDGLIDQMVKNITACKKLMDETNQAQGRTGDNKLSWGIGEYNASGEVPGFPVHSWENGQYFGVVLGLTMKYEGAYACTWSMFENGGDHGRTDFSFLDGNGLTPRASFRHMEMIAKNFSGEYADGTCAVAKLVTFGCVDAKTNKVCAMLINRTGQAYDYALRFDSKEITATKTKINIAANIPGEYSDNIGAGNTIMLVLNYSTKTGKKYTYTSGMFNQGSAPTTSDITFTVTPTSVSPSRSINTLGITYRQAGTNLEINLPTVQKHTISIIGLSGRVVKRTSVVGNHTTINAGFLPSGVYCLQVKAADGADFSKVIKVER